MNATRCHQYAHVGHYQYAKLHNQSDFSGKSVPRTRKTYWKLCGPPQHHLDLNLAVRPQIARGHKNKYKENRTKHPTYPSHHCRLCCHPRSQRCERCLRTPVQGISKVILPKELIALETCKAATRRREFRLGRDLIWDFIIDLFICYFPPSWLLKCSNLQHVLAKCMYSTLVRQHHQHRFQHHQQIEGLGFLHLQHHQFLSGKVGRHVYMLKRGAGPPHDGKSEDSSTAKLIPVKHLKSSGGVWGGGQPPP